MYAHPAIELKSASRLMLCRVCSNMPTVTFGSTGDGCSASCVCGIESHGVNLMLLALAWNTSCACAVSGRMVRGEIYDVHQSDVPQGCSFRVRLTHGDLSTFNQWFASVCDVEARSADAVSDFYYLLRASHCSSMLPGGLVVRNGSVVEIRHSEFMAAEINKSAQRALAEIQVLVDRALIAVS